MADVIIIGEGLAGLSAARTLAEAGISSVLVSPQRSERAASVLAEGGINAALDLMGEGDSWEQHFADTMDAGCHLADAASVAGMCSTAPEIVRSLIGDGVPFHSEAGRMVQRYFGGQKKARTAFVGSVTGKMLVGALVDSVRRFEAEGLVERLDFHELARFQMADGRCTGAVVRDVRDGSVRALAGPVILATGSLGGIFGPRTTGSQINTGDAAAIAFSQGVEMANLEFIQYHPTTIPIPGKRLLVTEAARGEGGRLFVLKDGEPYYFMEDLYPELGNLMPRDVVSREETRQLADPAVGDRIFLDMRHIPAKIWAERLADLRDELIRLAQTDPAEKPVEVEPGIHYCMGGIAVDKDHATNIAGLFAAGECAAAYHGANRLGGNSTLGAIYGGRVAARSATALLESGYDCGAQPTTTPELPAFELEPEVEVALEDAAYEALSIIRDAEGLERGRKRLDEIISRAQTERNVLRGRLALAAVELAYARKESRGAHTRSDFPEKDEAFRRTSIARWDGSSISCSLREIPSGASDIDLSAWEVGA